MCDAAALWTDLADRESDGLGVTLLWSRSSGRVKVVVDDSKRDESFELDVARADALAAFHHPFVYAPDRGARRDHFAHQSTDLQLQG
jgi:hypothetical protein